MYCRKPFVRDPTGSVFRSTNKEDWIKGVPFPCGKCLPCRINKRRQWTTRLVLESFCHSSSSFFTFTYNDENLPLTDKGLPTLQPRHFQLFMKRLRKELPFPIRFYVAGEYGSKSLRPHYHAIFFGLPTSTYQVVSRCWTNSTSHSISQCFACHGKNSADPVFSFKSSYGNVYFGYDCSIEALQYVAGYVTKKISEVGSTSDDPFSRHFYPDGRYREFSRMSRNPGIGIPALLSISKQLRDKALLDGKFPNFISLGKRTLPFDRTTRCYLAYLFPEYFSSDFVSDSMREFVTLRNSPDALSNLSESKYLPFGLLTGTRMLNDESKVENLINRLTIRGVFNREA